MNKLFRTFSLKTECSAELCDTTFPTSLHSWREEALNLGANGTHFGYVFQGNALLETDNGIFRLREKMYFCVAGSLKISEGAGIIATRLDYTGIFGIGGQIEDKGRLRYIDGCRDTLLIPPILQGDPCLNALYFPPAIRQTPHTHPSVRVGIVAKGHGECVTPQKVFPLNEGQAFIIAPEALHSFNTFDAEMIVIAYHPDSDFGPTHENHPMINRTMLNGISANEIDSIQTKT